MNNDMQFSSIDDVSAMQNSAHVLVICVGSKVQFPDSLCRLMAAEIEGCSYLRLTAPADLTVVLGDDSLNPQLVIVDETLWPQMNEAMLSGLRLDKRAAIAVAYRDAQRLAQKILGRSALPKGISLLPMDLNIESWLTIVRLLLTGYPFIPTEVLLATETAPRVEATEKQASTVGKLTLRECEVLSLVAQGLQNKTIAQRLDLSEHTVKLHLHHVISKMGARNRTDAALRYRLHEGA
jgi:DNA-binding NarL/FixJ family response regulator